MPKSVLLISLQDSLSSIWKNKSFFALLLFLQLIFFVAFSLVNYTYQSGILENAKAISEYLSNQKLDDISITSNLLEKKNILGEDPLLISRNFSEIAQKFRGYLASIFVLLIAFTSIHWTLSIRLLHKMSFKDLIRIFLKSLVVPAVYLGIIFSFFFSLFNITLTELA